MPIPTSWSRCRRTATTRAPGRHARDGGEEYAYRLRISPPQPDFALRVVPSSIGIRSKSTGTATVYAIRKDGFDGPIKVAVEDLPEGLTSAPVTLTANKEKARICVKTKLREMDQAVNLTVEGRAKIQDRDVAHEAVPAEDRMQAFLWRHLVPAEDLKAMVLNPSYQPLRHAPVRPSWH